MSVIVAFLVFAAALGLASHLGWSVDSRDGADWRGSDAGDRATPAAGRHSR